MCVVININYTIVSMLGLWNEPNAFVCVSKIFFSHMADSHEEFPSVPKVNPSLGLKAGHDRRDLAAARRPRPPTRKAATTAQQVRCLHNIMSVKPQNSLSMTPEAGYMLKLA